MLKFAIVFIPDTWRAPVVARRQLNKVILSENKDAYANIPISPHLLNIRDHSQTLAREPDAKGRPL